MNFLLGRLRRLGWSAWIGSPSGQVSAAGDQPRAAFVGDVGPRPLNEDQQPVAETDQEENVDEQPGQPRDEARDVDAAELGDCRRSADRREAAFVPVVELWARVNIPTLSQRTREGWGTRYLLLRLYSVDLLFSTHAASGPTT